MSMKTAAAIAALAFVCAQGASAATYNYDFKAAAEGSGAVSEAAYETFDTTTVWAGPGLDVTATGGPDDDPTQYVYFDAGNAGIGVCRDVLAGTTLGADPGNTGNKCDPGSDDGLTLASEYLTFTAQEDMIIGSIFLNSNHDPDDILDSVWEINGVTYDLSAGYVKEADGDVEVVLNFFLASGSAFDVKGISGPNSYISALVTSDVPLPAAGWMLIAGLGGLTVARRRRKT